VKPLLKPSPHFNLYHTTMRSPSFGLPSRNQITRLDLRERDRQPMTAPHPLGSLQMRPVPAPYTIAVVVCSGLHVNAQINRALQLPYLCMILCIYKGRNSIKLKVGTFLWQKTQLLQIPLMHATPHTLVHSVCIRSTPRSWSTCTEKC